MLQTLPLNGLINLKCCVVFLTWQFSIVAECSWRLNQFKIIIMTLFSPIVLSLRYLNNIVLISWFIFTHNTSQLPSKACFQITFHRWVNQNIFFLYVISSVWTFTFQNPFETILSYTLYLKPSQLSEGVAESTFLQVACKERKQTFLFWRWNVLFISAWHLGIHILPQYSNFNWLLR